MTVTRDSVQFGVWKQSNAMPFSHSQKGASSHKCWRPLWLTRLWAAAPARPSLTLGQRVLPQRRAPVLPTGCQSYTLELWVPAGPRNSSGFLLPLLPPCTPISSLPTDCRLPLEGTDTSLTNADHPASTRQDHTPKISPDPLKWFWSLSAPPSTCHKAPADSSVPEVLSPEVRGCLISAAQTHNYCATWSKLLTLSVFQFPVKQG